MPSTSTTLLTIALSLLAILPSASAIEKYRIGYTEETGHKIVMHDSLSSCHDEYTKLVPGPDQQHAIPCDHKFTAATSAENMHQVMFTNCGGVPPTVHEVDDNGVKGKQIGACVEDPDRKTCGFWDYYAPGSMEAVTFEWSCELSI